MKLLLCITFVLGWVIQYKGQKQFQKLPGRFREQFWAKVSSQLLIGLGFSMSLASLAATGLASWLYHKPIIEFGVILFIVLLLESLIVIGWKDIVTLSGDDKLGIIATGLLKTLIEFFLCLCAIIMLIWAVQYGYI